MERLQWMFQVLDGVSGPVGRMNSTLGKLDSGLKKTGGGFDALNKQGGSAMNSLSHDVDGGTSGMMSGLGALGAAALAAGAVAGGLAIAGGKWALSALSFKEDSLAAFTAMLGSAEAGDRVFKKAMAFAAKTPFKTSEVIGLAQSLISRGFKENELDKLMLGVGDIGAALGTEKMNSVVNALGKMRSNGKMTGETLEMLADAGINSKLVFASLAKTLGKSEEQVKALMSAGKITDAQGIAAAMDAIAKGISGGELGGMMDKKSKTLSGLWSTLTSLPEELLFGIDLSNVIGPIQVLLKKVTDVFGSDGVGGKAVQAFFTKVGDLVGRAVTALVAFDLAGWIETVSTVASTLWGLLEKVGEGFMSVFDTKDVLQTITGVFKLMVDRIKAIDPRVFKVLGVVIGALAILMIAFWATMMAVAVGVNYLIEGMIRPFLDLWDGVVWVTENIGTLFDFLGDKIKASWDALDFTDLGVSIILGIAQGLLSGGTGGMMSLIGDVLIAEFKAKMGIASPSKLFEGFGVNIVEGLIQGITSMAGAVASAIGGLVKMPDLGVPGIGAKSSLIAPAPPNSPMGAFNDTGPTGLFGSLTKGLPFMAPPQPNAMSMAAQPLPAAPPLPGAAPMSAATAPLPGAPPTETNSLLGSFGNLFGALAPSVAPTPTPPAAIPPGASEGPMPGVATAAPQAKGDQNFDLSGMNPVFHFSGGEQGEAAGKAAASSFMDQLAAGLKGLGGEMGG